jgi:hypothetical protein
MLPRMVAWLLVGTLLGPLVADASAQPTLKKEISPEAVREAIQKGISYLKGEQKKDGSWGDWAGQTGAVTSLCALALLNAGVKPDDPDVRRALENLRKLPPLDSTYALSLQTMVFCQATPERDMAKIRDNVRELVRIQKGDNDARSGAWGYRKNLGDGDNSNSQFALLALYDAERAGERLSVGKIVPDDVWRRAKRYWEGCQNPDGSWGYYRNMPGTGSMTCAGLGSLVICDEMARTPDARVNGEQIECCQRGTSEDDRIQRGLQWLGREFAVDRNPGSRSWLLYYLYGVERVGRMTAQRFMGKHDWYREGAEKLVRQQEAISGFWKGVGHAEDDPQIATSLALLFLSKGRRPTLLAKLKHGPEDDWNQHRGDVGRLTRYVEPKWGLDLTWQVVDLDAAGVDDLAQCPVLYLTGSRDPLPASPEAQEKLAQKLRDYLDRGGFLLAEAGCAGSAFDQGFRALMKRAFTEPEYQLRMLPPEHPIWRAEEPVAAKHQRTMLGIEFGCRTSVVYCPPYPKDAPGPSLSCLWEIARPGQRQAYPAAVQGQVDAALSIGINVLAYATNRELRTKDLGFGQAERATPGDTVERGKLYVASLRHPGGCTAAPRALVNLLEAAGRELKIRVNAANREVRITDESLFDYHLVFMHGRNSFTLTAPERERLRQYVERGGMILADSICASQAFSDSFRREMAAIFPKKALEQVPAGDRMLTPAYGGFDLKTVSRRDPEAAPAGGSRGPAGPLRATLRKVPPLLQGIKFETFDDHFRWGVIFSPYDLSCALEKHDSLECKGYVREDAARIGLNVILYSLQE